MDSVAIAALDRRFGIPGLARIVAGNGGLAKVAVTFGENVKGLSHLRDESCAVDGELEADPELARPFISP